MNRLITILLMVLIPAGATPAHAAAEGPIEFKFPHKLGETSRSRMITRVVGSVESPLPLFDQRIAQTVELIWSERCIEIKQDESAVIEVTIERYTGSLSFAGIKLSFDSERDHMAESRLIGPFAEMERILNFVAQHLGHASFRLITTPDGRTARVEGLGDCLGKAIEAIGKEIGGPAEGMLEQIRALMNDDVMKQNFDSGLRLVPPEGPVKAGDTWKAKWDFTMPDYSLAFGGEGAYELIGIEEFRGRRCAVVKASETYDLRRTEPSESEHAATRPASSAFASLMKHMTFDFESGGVKGVGYWDYENGQLILYKATDSMIMNIGFTPDVNAEDEQVRRGLPMIKQKLQTVVTLELLDAIPEEELATEGASATTSPADPSRSTPQRPGTPAERN